jgi:tRNA(fMet)-specific endonuclease VapC
MGLAMIDTYLLDTCMIRYMFDDTRDDQASKATLRFRARRQKVRDSPVVICAITLGEVEYGLRVARIADAAKQKLVRDALARFGQVVAIEGNTACPCYAQARADVFHRYAPREKRQKKREKILIDELTDPTSGRELTIQENDLWIACIALQYNFVLVSDDGDMWRIGHVCRDLRLENWLE